MKKIAWLGAGFLLLILVAGVFSAFYFGEKSPSLASGNIRLKAELQKDAVGIQTLFITIFDEESSMPMPYGAMRQRIGDRFDQENGQVFFNVTPERLQVMNPALPTPKRIRIKARLDVDGMGGADQQGDLFGVATGIETGSKDVAVLIDQKVL